MLRMKMTDSYKIVVQMEILSPYDRKRFEDHKERVYQKVGEKMVVKFIRRPNRPAVGIIKIPKKMEEN